MAENVDQTTANNDVVNQEYLKTLIEMGVDEKTARQVFSL